MTQSLYIYDHIPYTFGLSRLSISNEAIRYRTAHLIISHSNKRQFHSGTACFKWCDLMQKICNVTFHPLHFIIKDPMEHPLSLQWGDPSIVSCRCVELFFSPSIQHDTTRWKEHAIQGDLEEQDLSSASQQCFQQEWCLLLHPLQGTTRDCKGVLVRIIPASAPGAIKRGRGGEVGSKNWMRVGTTKGIMCYSVSSSLSQGNTMMYYRGVNTSQRGDVRCQINRT